MTQDTNPDQRTKLP
uniref:Uncharacterized protein n=1 Tax=Anguilla anguilla TaxID=7936 RepID=A0A0E9UXM8_ANGAN